MRRDLRSLGPLELLDRGLLVVRRGGLGFSARPLLGGALVAFVALGVFYLERIEGVRTLRPLLAFALVLAWWGRALLLTGAAREAAQRLSDVVRPPEGAGRTIDVLRTSSAVGLGLWVWLWLLVGASIVGAWAVPLVLPLLALRGAVAPSWLARAGCTADGGLRCLYRAASDQDGRRAHGITVELLLLLGALGLALDLFATVAVFLLLGRSMLGVDVAYLDSFVSIRNVFVLFIALATALVLMEPLRVALSALAFVDARVRQEGLDLQQAVDEAIESAARRGGASARRAEQAPPFGATAADGAGPAGGGAGARKAAAGAGAALLACALLWPLGARAQQGDEAPPPPAQLRTLPPGTGPDGVSPERDPASWDPTGTGMPPKEPADFASLLGGGGTISGAAIPEVPAQVASVDDEAVRADVRRILAQREFREFADDRGKGLGELFERLLEWLLRDREEPQAELGGAPSFRIPMPPAGVFLVGGALLLLLVLAYVVASRRRAQQVVQAPAGASAEALDPRERTPEAHLDDAALLARDGRYREALRALYVATLVSLDRRRIIAFDPALTNWQYIRPMPRTALREDFVRFTRLFDHKWYGDEATTQADYEACRTLADRICLPGAAREAA